MDISRRIVNDLVIVNILDYINKSNAAHMTWKIPLNYIVLYGKIVLQDRNDGSEHRIISGSSDTIEMNRVPQDNA